MHYQMSYTHKLLPCQELRFLPFHFLSYTTPTPNIKSTNTLFNSNYKFPSHSQFCLSNFAKSKCQTKFWEQCSLAPLHSFLTFGLRLLRQNVRKRDRTWNSGKRRFLEP
jgi:hypothetical protein